MRKPKSRRRIVAPLVALPVAWFGLTAPTAQANEAPPAPTNLRVTDVGWHTVGLAWNAPDDIPTSWYYKISFVSRGWSEWVSTWEEPSHSMPYIDPESTYTFEVSIVGDGTESEPSNRVTVTTPDLPHVEPPTGLEATEVYAGSVTLGWQAGSNDAELNYQVRDLTRGATLAKTPDPTKRILQAPGETHIYEVVAIHEDSGAVSDPSGQLAVATPDLPAPDDVQASHNGNDVTVTWSRPEELDPALHQTYTIFDNGAPVAALSRHDGVDGAFEHTLLRVPMGMTHSYTVEVRQDNVTAMSDAMAVTVPPSPDTTPPTAPAATETFVYETGVTTFRITEQSTDDTSPQSEIWYEALTYQIIDGERVFFTLEPNLPLEFDDSDGHRYFPQWIRAVDEAGNRSEIISPEFILIDN